MKKHYYLILALIPCCIIINAADTIKYHSPGAKNPIIPGYFADPTVVKFDDTYYLYATTDNEMLAGGAPTVWVSKDFQNWHNYLMDVPKLSADPNLVNFWAPDIIKGDDGRYYLYFGNCQGNCNIYGYVSDTPIGPWTKLSDNDNAVIPYSYPADGFPSLDAQFLRDDDNTIYAYWGTWVHYNNGYAVGILNNKTLSAMDTASQIPIEQTPEPFEAAYPMKRNNTYILMYSSGFCQDASYNVRYSYAKNPFGPFTPGVNSPILQSDIADLIHGTGHNSVLKNGDNYYIVYHRHDYPYKKNGHSRQVCVDSLIFENDSTIKTVDASHRGIAPFLPSVAPENLAFMAKISASSHYHMQLPEYDEEFIPEYAVDDNNATLWKAADNTFPQNLTLDLGGEKVIQRVATSFEFSPYYYQYKIEYSTDSINWNLYADRLENRIPGSPMIDDDNVTARYIKLTVTGSEKSGLAAAVWNIKAYESTFEIPIPENKASTNNPGTPGSKSLLVEFDLDTVSYSNPLTNLPNGGTLGGTFTKGGNPIVSWDSTTGYKAILFDKSSLGFSPVPKSLAWNGSFTVATWAMNPKNLGVECLATWTNRLNFSQALSAVGFYYNLGVSHNHSDFNLLYNGKPALNLWHHMVCTFDGNVVKIYIDGKLNASHVLTLASYIDDALLYIGRSEKNNEYFSGYMASMRIYDYALTPEEIDALETNTKPKEVEGPPALALTSVTEDLFNVYYNDIEKRVIIENPNHAAIKSIHLLSMDGRYIAGLPLNGSLTGMDDLKKGVYIVNVIIASNQSFSHKLVVY
jgi:xylan 1,4-beta-xylosidase